MLELLNKNFKTSIIDMLLHFYRKIWIECAYTKREMEIWGKTRMKILGLENVKSDGENVLIGSLNAAEESISRLENRSIKINQTETQREKKHF